MTYTLAMTAEQGIQIAADGVAEVSMTKARALLTSLIREVRWGRKVGAFSERGERTAYVVTPDFYEQAVEDRRVLYSLSDAFHAMPEDRRAKLLQDLQAFQEVLAAKERGS